MAAKSDFIRQQPASLSTAEVIAKAKAAGIKVSSSLVYMARGRGKAKKSVAKKTSTAKPVAAVTTSSAKVSKADFVRARSHLSPKEIVEDGKAAGIKVDVSYVYKGRGAAKSKGKGKKRVATKARATPRTGVAVPRPITTTSSAENLLKALGAEIGLGRAIEILAGERARVRAVIGAG